MKPTTMLYRNLMAMDVEESIRSYPLDGVVLLTGCDKTNPASIMGAASADIPSIVVTGGPMLNGHWRGREIGSCSDCWHYHEELRAGRITEAEWVEIENSMSRSNGHCMTMGTASTMACVTEAIGLTLAGGAAIPAVDSRRHQLAETAGRQIVALVGERPEAVRHPHARGVRERNPRLARDLGLDERDPAPHRLCRTRRCRAPAAALRRAVHDDPLARRPEARRAVSHGGLLLRRRRAGRDDTDRRPVAPRRRHGLRPHGSGRTSPARRSSTRRSSEAGRLRSTGAARSSCSAATSARTAR